MDFSNKRLEVVVSSETKEILQQRDMEGGGHYGEKFERNYVLVCMMVSDTELPTECPPVA